MSLNEVFITRTSHFLPNEPVSNDDIEEYLGYINNKPSKSKRLVLRNNGITKRYYAIDRSGKSTHTNAEMVAQSIRGLFDKPEDIRQLDLISCGTSSPDQLMPSHGVQVHGSLPEAGIIEVVSPSGVCCAGMHALKYAYMSVRTGEAHTAVATGSERLSRTMRSEMFDEEASKLEALAENPYIGFEKEFLRWMLSDGAGAFLLSDKKNENGLNLRIDWLDGFSYAQQMEACMYMGSDKDADGNLISYKDFTNEDLIGRSIMSIKQDVKLLGEHVVPLGITKMRETLEKRGWDVKDVNYFLPHMSSNFFRTKIFDEMDKQGIPIPYENWFVNLPNVGNVGAASIYLMVDELFQSGKLKKGDRILLLVPESSRFSYMYGGLTVC